MAFSEECQLNTKSDNLTAMKKYLISPNTIRGLNLSLAVLANRMKNIDASDTNM